MWHNSLYVHFRRNQSGMSLEKLKHIYTMFGLRSCVFNGQIGDNFQNFSRYVGVIVKKLNGFRKVMIGAVAFHHVAKGGKRSSAKTN